MAQTAEQTAHKIMSKWFDSKPYLISFSIDGVMGDYKVTVQTATKAITTLGSTRLEAINKMKATYKVMKKAKSL